MSGTPPLWSLCASELAERYQTGETDPVAVLVACLARLDAVNPVLNAVVTIDRRGSLEAAAASRARWAAGRPLSPLDGVPVTVKDNLYVAGMRATWGSLLFADFVPKEDDLAVARLRAAGAVILGKTNTPELSLAGHTDNRLFGSTGNPWAPELTPGGSSGGAVAAVMGGIAPIALATDAGGSIRRPASHTGCVGLRTSVGLVPRRHGFPPLADDLQTIGVLARSIADAKLALGVISDERPRIEPVPGPLTIAAFARLPAASIDQAVIASFETAVAWLRNLGHTVTLIDPPYDPDKMTALLLGLASAGIACVLERIAPEKHSKVSDTIAKLADIGRAMPAREYVAQKYRIAEFRWVFRDLFGMCDLLLTPTAAALPWPRDVPFPSEIDGVPVGPRASAIYTTFVNVAGLPAISIPGVPSPNGLPVGIQLVAPLFGDALLLSLGADIERQHPWQRLARAVD